MSRINEIIAVLQDVSVLVTRGSDVARIEGQRVAAERKHRMIGCRPPLCGRSAAGTNEHIPERHRSRPPHVAKFACRQIQRVGLFSVFRLWRSRRHYRRELRRMLTVVGPHMIADIGLTLKEARDEMFRPFWRR